MYIPYTMTNRKNGIWHITDNIITFPHMSSGNRMRVKEERKAELMKLIEEYIFERRPGRVETIYKVRVIKGGLNVSSKSDHPSRNIEEESFNRWSKEKGYPQLSEFLEDTE